MQNKSMETDFGEGTRAIAKLTNQLIQCNQTELNAFSTKSIKHKYYHVEMIQMLRSIRRKPKQGMNSYMPLLWPN